MADGKREPDHNLNTVNEKEDGSKRGSVALMPSQEEDKDDRDLEKQFENVEKTEEKEPDSTVIIAAQGKQSYESRALDGGWGWFIVLGCMLMHLLIGGLNRSYGVMYIELRSMFKSSAAVTAWVGGACVAVRMGLSPIATALSSRFSTRIVMLSGGVLLGISMVISAYTPSTEFMFFSYSLLAGIGGTLVYSPAIVLVGQYFHRLRAIAAALASCGSGLGMFVFPPLIAYLFENFSYSGACLILAGVMFNCCVSGALMRPLEMNHKATKLKTPLNSEAEMTEKSSSLKQKQFDTDKLKRQYLDFSLWKHPVFLSFSISQGFITMAYFAGQMLLSDYARVNGSSLQESVRLLSYLGIADTVGRLSGGFLFDTPFIRPHRIHVYNAYIFISASTCFMWAATNSYIMIVVVSIIHGLFNGSVVSQRSVIAADLFGAERLGSTFGMTVFVQGCGLMVGPFIAGLIKDKFGSYIGSYIFCGVSGLISGSVYMCGSLGRACRNQKQKEKLDAKI